jgi:YceI-like domain.
MGGMKKIRPLAPILLLSTLLLPACGKSKGVCSYSGDPKDVQVVWTAFKFTGKTPVKGRFTSAAVSGTSSASSLAELLRGLKIQIDGATVETDNPGRNATIQQFFFEKFAGGPKIAASVAKVEGDDQKGSLTLNINMNGVAKDVSFPYSVSPDGVLTATGSIDMMEFSLQGPFDSLHGACEDLHKGPDGVSKTWTQVDLSVTGKFTKSCK